MLHVQSLLLLVPPLRQPRSLFLHLLFGTAFRMAIPHWQRSQLLARVCFPCRWWSHIVPAHFHRTVSLLRAQPLQSIPTIHQLSTPLIPAQGSAHWMVIHHFQITSLRVSSNVPPSSATSASKSLSSALQCSCKMATGRRLKVLISIHLQFCIILYPCD